MSTVDAAALGLEEKLLGKSLVAIEPSCPSEQFVIQKSATARETVAVHFAVAAVAVQETWSLRETCPLVGRTFLWILQLAGRTFFFTIFSFVPNRWQYEQEDGKFS